MKKNGFTLVELLAVLVIISIITLIATPNIINLMKQGRETEFADEANRMLTTAKTMYKTESKRNVFECNEDKTECKITVNKLDGSVKDNDPYGYKYDSSSSYIEFGENNCSDNICQRTISIYIKSCSEKNLAKCHYICNDNVKEITVDDITEKESRCNIAS